MIRRLLIVLIGLWPVGVLAQTSIDLRSSARIPSGRSITLADIALIVGEDADTLGATPIMPSPASSPVEIDLQTVRNALDGAGVRWGRTTLRGSTCTVATISAGAPAGRKEAPSRASSLAPVSLDGPETVRTQVVLALAGLYSVTPADMRLLFDERDAELLNLSSAGRRIDVQPTSSAATSRVGVRIYVFSGDRLLEQRVISVETLIRRRVVTAVGPLARRQPITSSDFTVSEQWLAPSAAIPCTPEQAVGAVARSRIGAGQIITPAVIEAPLVVKKGDIVEVHCLSGSVHLKATRARALGNGRDGELVEFQLDGSKHKFKARMSGRGCAVLVLDAPAALQPVSPSQELPR